MKSLRTTACLLILLANAAQGQEPTAKKKSKVSPLETAKDKVSYGLGFQFAQKLQKDGFDVTALGLDIRMLTHGIVDSLMKRSPRMSPDEFNAARQEFDQQRKEMLTKLGAKNLVAGNAFLAANKTKPGVETLPSGIQFQIMEPGTGESPKLSDVVRVHYRGSLISGEVFESTFEEDRPAQSPLNNLIEGWKQVLPLMKEGEKRKLFIPANLAYKERGRLPKIEPNSTLIFEIQLVEIVKP